MTTATKLCIRGRIGDQGDQFSDDELDAVIEVLEGRRSQRVQDGRPDTGLAGLRDDAAREAFQLKLEAAVTKRNKAMDLVKAVEARRRISKFSLGKSTAGTGVSVKETVHTIGGKRYVERAPGGMDDVQGLEGQISKSNKRVDEAHVSIESQTEAYRNEFLGEMFADLKRAELLPYLQARKILGVGFGPGPLDRQIALEIWELNKADGKPGISDSPEALKIARIVHKHMDNARIKMNRQGAWVQELTGYIATQSHDRLKLQRAGYDEWFAYVVPRMDMQRTFGKRLDIDKLDKAMREIYQTLTAGRVIDDLPVGPQLDFGVNVAKKESQHRVIILNDAEAWMDYNDQYGSGSLFTAVQNTMNRAAQTTGLLSITGTNPEAFFKERIAELVKLNRGDVKVTQRLTGSRLQRLIDVATGEVDRVEDPTFAAIGQTVREYESVTGLGGALLSSVTTDPLTRANQLQFNGMNALESAKAAIIDLVGADKSHAADMAFGLDALGREVSARFHGSDTMGARSSKAAAIGMSATTMPWWDNLGEKAMAATFGHNLWRQRETAWGALNERLRGTLALYGFDQKRWDVVRRHASLEREGVAEGVLSALMVRDIPDSEILSMIDRKRASGQVISNARDQLEQQLRSYYANQIDIALARPGYRIKALTTMGQKRGTALGEIARSVFLWKGYSLNFMQRVLGQFTEEDNYIPSIRGIMAMPRSNIAQASGLVAALVIGGYGSMVLKDLSKGREPRDPRDPRTWGAAAAQGGGLGIYGDFIFGQANRYGAGPVGTFLGPVASDVDVGLSIIQAAFKGDVSGTEVYNLTKTNLPLINLWYSRAAFDYLVLYRIQEALNPGSLRRMERRLKRENDQEFIVPPSEVVN